MGDKDLLCSSPEGLQNHGMPARIVTPNSFLEIFYWFVSKNNSFQYSILTAFPFIPVFLAFLVRKQEQPEGLQGQEDVMDFDELNLKRSSPKSFKKLLSFSQIMSKSARKRFWQHERFSEHGVGWT